MTIDPPLAFQGSRDTAAGALTPRERFIAALERRPLPGLVPHFELVFFLTMEALGKVHPTHRRFDQWLQMSENERRLQRRDIAAVYVETAEKYGHDAIFLQVNPLDVQETCRMLDAVRDLSGDRYFILLHGDATMAIPNGGDMQESIVRMATQPDEVQADLNREVDRFIKAAEAYKAHGALDGFALCSDYCMNTGPFLSLDWFDEFVMPHLKREIEAYRALGLYTIKHTDGNIMPILDRLVEANPHALHSIDPQGGVDMAEIVRRVGDRVCLCGNVNCGLMQTGTEAETIESARYALREGMKAPGYIFCTSNCVFTGMDLRRYDLILDVWHKEGIRR